MTDVLIVDDPFGAAVSFRFDRAIVDVIKELPGPTRWDPTRKVWTLGFVLASELAGRLGARGHQVLDRRGAGRPACRVPAPARTWAEELLSAVGPTRSDAAFKALTRVLHPDVATGDTRLMQQLNSARAQIGSAV